MDTHDAVQTVLAYHRETNHSVASLMADRHTLDFSILPRLYKLYRRAEAVPLPDDPPPSSAPALDAIAGDAAVADAAVTPTLDDVSALLKYSAGITKWLTVPNGSMAFRAASCTGALYHIELYLVCADLPGLPAGVYQYGVQDGALHRVRDGDFRGALAAAAHDPTLAAAPVAVAYTSVFWRNAWKYQARAYRHTYWDCGTVLANTLALANARGLPARLLTGFVDDDLNRLLDVDGAKEAAVAVVAVGDDPAAAAMPVDAPGRLRLESLPYSPVEVDYPIIRATHRATSLDADGAAAWRAASTSTTPLAEAPSPWPPSSLTTSGAGGEAGEPIERVIRRRGSSRRFQQAPIDVDALRTMLAAAMGPVPGDWPALDGGAPLNTLYLIVNAVDGLPSGAYAYDAADGELALLRAGEFRQEAGHLGLNQPLAHDAAVNAYFLSDLDAVLARMGARGYRAAHLDASIRAGRLYLAAYALGLGATGLTFFDDEVTAFFSPHAANKSVTFLTLLGRPAKRAATA